MKIAQVVSTFPPYRGGMGNVAYHLTDHLSLLGFDVTVFTPKYSSIEHSFDSYFKIKKLSPQFRYGNAAVVLQLCYKLPKFDTVHFHYPFLGASLPTIIAKLIKKKKIKLILHYHMDLVGRDWRSLVYKLYNWTYLGWLVKFSDKILITSEDYLKTSLIYPLYKKYQNKFKILPNGVDINYFKPQTKDIVLVNRYGLQNKRVVLFVGALDSAHYFKGINYLIKAFEILKRDDVKLIIIGEGNLRHVYEDMVHSYGLNNQVVFTGYVPDEELVKYYNLCDIFILPSIDKSEAFGMVLLEAMSCNKPVIATDLPGVREVVSNKVDGCLAKPKNADKLAQQLNILLDNPKLCNEYGNSGRKKVVELYSWEKITKELLEIYRS